jgi:N-acetylmuramoyl-L-alanine amidase
MRLLLISILSCVSLAAVAQENLRQPAAVAFRGASSTPPVIVIDPGHGGYDPGATGPQGLHEKNIALSISNQLKMVLNQQGFKAYLTRSSDEYLSLKERLAFAEQHKANLFISIHADAYKGKDSYGASVFTMSPKGRSEGRTKMAAASFMAGEKVIQALKPVIRLHHPDVLPGNFEVLGSLDFPSLLVEVGFISNIYGEKNLSSSAYQKNIVSGLAKGVESYFTQKASQSAELIRYSVRRGETLSHLSRLFHVSVSAIQSENHLKSTQIKIGQVLLIPAHIPQGSKTTVLAKQGG